MEILNVKIIMCRILFARVKVCLQTFFALPVKADLIVIVVVEFEALS